MPPTINWATGLTKIIKNLRSFCLRPTSSIKWLGLWIMIAFLEEWILVWWKFCWWWPSCPSGRPGWAWTAGWDLRQSLPCSQSECSGFWSDWNYSGEEARVVLKEATTWEERRDQGKINKSIKDINDHRAGRGKYREMLKNNNKTKCLDNFLFSLSRMFPNNLL